MEIQLIECDKIDFPKVKGELRGFSKEFGKHLAVSIKAEGMHHAIAVRPHPAAPGRYLGVQGKHRHYAKGKVLREQFIECNVLADMDDEDAAMAAITENLWRNPLTKAQHIKCLKKWWDRFAPKNPEPRDKVQSFAKTVSAATGQFLSAIKSDTRIARAFDDEEFEVLDQMKISKADMLTIAKVKDEAERGGIINLIAVGMEAEDAIKEVLKDKAPKRDSAKSSEDREAKDAAKKEFVSELSDDEWFERYCGEKAKMFAGVAQYKSDAIMFRKLSDLRHAFRSRAKATIKAAKDSGLAGPLYHLLNRFISISHPKDWMICGGCLGKGIVKQSRKKCGECYGGGYLLVTLDLH